MCYRSFVFIIITSVVLVSRQRYALLQMKSPRYVFQTKIGEKVGQGRLKKRPFSYSIFSPFFFQAFIVNLY